MATDRCVAAKAPAARGDELFTGTGLEAEFAKIYLGASSRPEMRGRHTAAVAAADGFGIAGLAELVAAALRTHNSGGAGGGIGFGQDLRTSGLRLDQAEPLSRSFVSPWFDASLPLSTAHAGCLDSVLPACYNVQPSPGVASKIPGLVDETLFYMFYAMPGDRLQEMAAAELCERHWRFHKELKIWVLMTEAAAGLSIATPDLLSAVGVAAAGKAKGPVALSATGAPRGYTVFDPQTWTKITRELPIRPEQLEDRHTAAKAPAPTPTLFTTVHSTKP